MNKNNPNFKILITAIVYFVGAFICFVVDTARDRSYSILNYIDIYVIIMSPIFAIAGGAMIQKSKKYVLIQSMILIISFAISMIFSCILLVYSLYAFLLYIVGFLIVLALSVLISALIAKACSKT